MEHDQDYLDFLRTKQKPPEWALYFSMLEDAVKSFLGDLDVKDFLSKFNCRSGDYVDALFWIFDINEEDGDPRPKFEEVWETIFPDLHVDAKTTKKELQKRIFERIHAYCNEQEVKNLTNTVVQKFGEILQALDSTIGEVKKRHEEGRSTKKEPVIIIPITEEGAIDETPGTNGRRGAEPGGDDPGEGDPGVAEGDPWVGCLFDGVDGGGDDSADGGGIDGGIRPTPTGRIKVRIRGTKKISITG